MLFAVWLKIFSSGVPSIEGILVIFSFQMTFSIEKFREGFGYSNVTEPKTWFLQYKQIFQQVR